MKVSRIIFGLLISLMFCLGAARPIFCQSEKFDIIEYTPPKNWTRTEKPGAIVYSDVNKAANAFCVLTIYQAATSSNSATTDFGNDWKTFVAKPFKAEENPQTDSQAADGWTVISASAPIESDGIKSLAIMTTFSGYGVMASILAVSNSEIYIKPIGAFLESIKLDKSSVKLKPPPTVDTGSSSNSFVGKWARSFSGTQGRDQSANVLNSEYYKSQYTFNSDGTYVFKAEKWLGYIKSNEFWITDEAGNYTVSGAMLTIIPKKSVTTLKNREGVSLSTQANPLERTTYKWTLYYFAGIKETNLILQTDNETRRDGPFGSNDLFPRSYFFSQKYVPEWKF
jgi:hypothetical protein